LIDLLIKQGMFL